MRRTPAFLRIPRVVRLMISGILVLACSVLAIGFFALPVPPRVTMVLATDPVALWSWDTTKNVVTMVVLPAEAVTDAAWGYGTYSLEALWKLGHIERHRGTLLAKSLTHAIALPVDYYWGAKTESLMATDDPLAQAKALFTVQQASHFIAGSTNVPLRLLVAQLWAIRTAKADQFIVHDLTRAIKTVKEELPDGSRRVVIDVTQVDELLAHIFEDDAVRSERMSVAIYNTTATPALGGKAARIVNAMGAFVIAVGNDEPEVDVCTIQVAKDKMDAVTVIRLKTIFSCLVEEQMGNERADIALRIGTRYESEFLPLTKP